MSLYIDRAKVDYDIHQGEELLAREQKEEELPVSVIREKVKKRYNDIFNSVMPGAAMNNKTTIADRYSSALELFAFK